MVHRALEKEIEKRGRFSKVVIVSSHLVGDFDQYVLRKASTYQIVLASAPKVEESWLWFVLPALEDEHRTIMNGYGKSFS